MSQQSLHNDIRELSLSALTAWLVNNKEQTFRAKQIYEWLWLKGVTDFDKMTNLSKELRLLLSDFFVFKALQIDKVLKSTDETLKVAFKTYDNEIVEGVLIPSADRITACISSQVGCPLNCAFCATGSHGFKKDLSKGEIFDQFILLNQLSQQSYNKTITNYVIMGMGEPLLNYHNVKAAVDVISNPNMHNISPRRITWSTVGIIPVIKQMADEGFPYELAVSLHTANENLRNKLMPINKKYGLSELSKALKYFYEKTQTRITFEYVLLDNINDSLKSANELAQFCKIVPCKINIISYNPFDKSPFKASTSENTQKFIAFLENKNLIVNYRRSRGSDIAAACGQLAGKKY